MSGVLKSVSKVFKKVGDAVSSVAKSDAFKVALIAGFVYLTAGAASGTFPPVEPGTTAALGAEAGGTFTGTAEIFGGVETVTGGAVTAETAAATAVADTAGYSAAGELAAGGDVLAADIAAGNAVADTAAANIAAATPAGTTVATGNGLAYTLPSAASPGVMAADAAANTGGILGWMQSNPMATMLMGQGVSGAVSAYEADKMAEREEKRLRNRGLMGVDYEGNYQGKPSGGIVASNMGRDATAAQVVNSPGVQQPGARKTRPIARNKLPELHKQGLIARQRVS
jgi:hypothetical protein